MMSEMNWKRRSHKITLSLQSSLDHVITAVIYIKSVTLSRTQLIKLLQVIYMTHRVWDQLYL